MTSTRSTSTPDQGPPDPALWLDAGTPFMSESVVRALAASHPDARDLVDALETAQEELSVASEEVRTQHETISRLMASHKCLRVQQERTLGILPVPAFVTDMHGRITSANAAAAVTLHTGITHLLGKPLVSLFSPDDSHRLRRLISTAQRGGDEGRVVRCTATLLDRRGGPAQVELTGSVQLVPAAQDEIAWFLLSSTDTVAPAGLSESLATMATLTHRSSDLRAVLCGAVTTCASVLDAHVTIALGHPAQPETVASSSQEAQACDGAQLALGDGPSLHAYTSGTTVVSTSLPHDDRWPGLQAHLPPGIGAAAPAPIVQLDDVVGTVTAYAATDRPLEQGALVIIAQTLGGVLHELHLLEDLARLQEDMDHALSSRAVIEQAKGMIMASRHIGADAAWEHLVRLSSAQERKVREIAADIVAGAELPH